MSALTQIRRNLLTLSAIAALVVLAGAVAFFILRHERLRLPTDPYYTLSAEMPTAQALTPGQGQSATVAGVQVGQVSSVRLVDGRALVQLSIDRRRLPQDELRTDAHLTVRPRTPLDDMTVDIDPGSARAPRLADGAVLDVSHTTPNVNLDEVLASLDADTRAYLETLIDASGRGLRDAGPALRMALRAGAPTLAMTRRVSGALAARRAELARAVRNMRLLTAALSREDGGIARLVGGGDATFSALAAEAGSLRSAVAQLPGTLGAGRAALRAVTPFAAQAGPALASLLPATRALPAALRAADPLLVRGTPALQRLSTLSLRTTPMARDLAPALANLQAATPQLTSVFGVLQRLVNELAYAPKAPDHGYLFWLAWFSHNLDSFQGGQDANGAFWRGSVVVSCSSGLGQPALMALLGPAVAQAGICPQGPRG